MKSIYGVTRHRYIHSLALSDSDSTLKHDHAHYAYAYVLIWAVHALFH